MKIAIIGSRDFTDYELLKRTLDDFILRLKINTTDLVIVSGGAKGADSLAEQYAESNNIETLIFKADWKRFGRGAGFIRNKDIISCADYVIAFWDGKSRGTKHSLDLTKKQGTPIKIIYTNQTPEDSQLELW